MKTLEDIQVKYELENAKLNRLMERAKGLKVKEQALLNLDILEQVGMVNALKWCLS